MKKAQMERLQFHPNDAFGILNLESCLCKVSRFLSEDEEVCPEEV